GRRMSHCGAAQKMSGIGGSHGIRLDGGRLGLSPAGRSDGATVFACGPLGPVPALCASPYTQIPGNAGKVDCRRLDHGRIWPPAVPSFALSLSIEHACRKRSSQLVLWSDTAVLGG